MTASHLTTRGSPFHFVPVTVLTLAIACASACGPVERSDDRTRIRGDANLEPEVVTGQGDALPGGRPDASGKPADQADPAGEGGSEGDTAADGTPQLQRLFTSAGLRNYEQINATMATVTGVPASTATVRGIFVNQLSTSLPTDNDVKAFLGSHQVAVFKLAVAYCEALTGDAPRRAALFGAFNFGAAPAQALNAAGKAAVADALISRFWGKGLESLPDHEQSVGQVVTLLDGLLQGKNLNTVAVTPAVVTAACTAVLSSAPVTMF